MGPLASPAPRRAVRLLLAVLSLGLVFAACGGNNEIGSGLEADGSKQGSNAIGQATTTTAAPVTTTARSQTTAKPTVTTAAVPSAIFKIQDDNKGQYIDPLHHSVRAGSLVRFVNEDDTPHTISFKTGGQTVPSMNSPTIAPNGGVWDLRPTQRGTFDIVDNERTYAVGATLTVGG